MNLPRRFATLLLALLICAALPALGANYHEPKQSADDECNPFDLGVMEREIKRIKNARYVLIPASPDTRGHGTTGMAKLYKKDLAELLQQAPRR